MTTSSSTSVSPSLARSLQTTASVFSVGLTLYVIAAPFLFAGAVMTAPLLVAVVLVDAVAVITAVCVLYLSRQTDQRLAEAQQHRAHDQALAGREVEKLRTAFEKRDAEWRQQVGEQSQELIQALDELLWTRLSAVWKDESVPAATTGGDLDPRVTELLDKVATEANDAAGRQHERLESMQTALLALGRRVQAGAHRIQEQAVLMARRHPADPDVLEVSNAVDHAAAVQARLAQSLAVLSGHWEGQQWPEALPLDEVIRAAAGRITDYNRIELPGPQPVAVAARATEPLIHLLAELLANAAQSSPKTTKVMLSIRTVHQGTAVEIDDGGVGLDEHRLEKAREIASGRRRQGLDELGVIPQTGLPVVGEYVRRHGFRVDLQESVYGGLRAVVLVPAALVEIVEPQLLAHAALTADVQEIERQVAELPSSAAPSATPSGLPQRRSRRGAAATAEASTPEATPVETPDEAGKWMEAFFEGAATTGDVEAVAEPVAPEHEPGAADQPSGGGHEDAADRGDGADR